jgi:predicted transposase/invertase (TIGR01784 family)
VIEHLQLVFIELPKFPVQSIEEKKLRLLWLRFLREVNEKTISVAQELLDIPEISEAVKLAEEAAYTPGELNSYESYWDAVRTEKTLLLGKYDEGMARGMARGMAEGIVEGEARGIEKGKAEGIAQGIIEGKIEMVKEMCAQGISLDIIATVSGLSREIIAKLANE